MKCILHNTVKYISTESSFKAWRGMLHTLASALSSALEKLFQSCQKRQELSGLASSARWYINTGQRQKQMSQNLLTCPWQERRAQRGKKKTHKKKTGKHVVKDTHKLWLSVHTIHIYPLCQEAGKNRPAGEIRLLQMLFLPTDHGPVTAIYLYYYAKKKERSVGGLSQHLWLLIMISTQEATQYSFQRQKLH